MSLISDSDESSLDKTDGKQEMRLDPKDAKREFLGQIFGHNIGNLVKDYHCSLVGRLCLHGRIYILDRCFAFYCRLLGHEKKLMVPFQRIRTVTAPQGVLRNITVDIGAKQYVFRSFWEPDKTFHTMSDALDKFRSDGQVVDSALEFSDTDSDAELPNREKFEERAAKWPRKGTVADGVVLPINLSDFMATFIEEGAPHSFKKYHESVQDKNVTETPWQEVGMDEYQRDLQYAKPIHVPSLTSTRTVKSQYFQRYGDVGVLFSSSTRMEDVPSADCFSVEDVLIIRSCDGPDTHATIDGSLSPPSGSHISLHMSFEIAFSKSTFVRKLVESSTERESKKWMEAYFQHIQDVIAKKDIRVCTVPRARRPTLASASVCGSQTTAASLLNGTESVCSTNTTPNSLSSLLPGLAPSLASSSFDLMQAAAHERSLAAETNNSAKQEFLNQTFHNPGAFYKDYYCAFASTILVQGRIYATDRCVLFYSKLFGREKKLMIPFNHIRQISTPQGVLRSIIIETEHQHYVFRSFWEPEKSAYYLNEAFERSKANGDRATQRRLSDEPDAECDGESGDGQEDADPLVDDRDQFRNNAEKLALKVKVVNDAVLPIGLNDFFATFIEEGAPHSYGNYHTSVNDKEVIMLQWSEVRPNEYQRDIKFMKPVNLPGLASTRGVKSQLLMRFGDHGFLLKSSTHLEDVPAADCFSVEDILMVHCLDNNSNNNSNGGNAAATGSGGCKGVAVHISFEVVFVKSTMMKSFIEGPTEREMKKWLEAFFAHTSDVVTKGDIRCGTNVVRRGSVASSDSTCSATPPVGAKGLASAASFVQSGLTHRTGHASGSAQKQAPAAATAATAAAVPAPSTASTPASTPTTPDTTPGGRKPRRVSGPSLWSKFVSSDVALYVMLVMMIVVVLAFLHARRQVGQLHSQVERLEAILAAINKANNRASP